MASWIAPAAPEPYSYGFTDQCRADSFIRFLGNDFVSTEMSVVRLNEAKADSAVEVFVVRCHRREALDEFWAHCREGGE